MSSRILPLGRGGVPPSLPVLIHWLREQRGCGVGLAARPVMAGHLPDLFVLAGIDQVGLGGPRSGTEAWCGDGGAQVTLMPLPPEARPAPLPEVPRAAAPAGFEQVCQVANPLPFRRRGSVRIPWVGPAPQSFQVDRTGARIPAQALADGVLTTLELGAVEIASLVGRSEAAPGARWEVSERVLDNGLVRAEFDAQGRIARLCFAGVFIPLAGLLVDPGTSDAVQVSVLESGPVRARVRVSRPDLLVDIRLEVDQSLLWIDVVLATGDQRLGHSTDLRSGPARFATDGRWHDDLTEAPARTVCLPDASGGGLLTASATPIPWHANDGNLTAMVATGTSYALGDPRLDDPALVIEEAAMPIRPTASPARSPGWHWQGDPGLVPILIPGSEGRDDLLIIERSGRPARGWLHGPSWHGAEIIDLHGVVRSRLPVTGDGDGIQIDLGPAGMLLLRSPAP